METFVYSRNYVPVSERSLIVFSRVIGLGGKCFVDAGNADHRIRARIRAGIRPARLIRVEHHESSPRRTSGERIVVGGIGRVLEAGILDQTFGILAYFCL